MNTSTQKIVISEQASFTELLENQEGVILDLGSLHYYTLNGTAIFLWKLLRGQAAQTAETLSENLAATFGLGYSQAASDTKTFVHDLRQYGLISLSDLNETDVLAGVNAQTNAALPAYEAPQLQPSNSLLQVTLASTSTVSSAISSGS